MRYLGGCHCGNLTVEFESEMAPGAMQVRECQCDFCRKHGTRAVADPAGNLIIRVSADTNLSRYTFGFATAEYLICRICGVYVAAVTAGHGDPRGLVLVNALEDRASFPTETTASVYDAETEEMRVARRQSSWTPAQIFVA